MSLIRRIREKIEPLREEYLKLPLYSIPRFKKAIQIDELMQREFSRRNYENFEALFTRSKPMRQDGKIVRAYSDVPPDGIEDLLKRLSYNPQNPLDVQLGKYVALLIGYREAAAQSALFSPEHRGEWHKVVDAIKSKLEEFPFYNPNHPYDSRMKTGRGYGHSEYAPPRDLFLKSIKTKAA